MEWFENLFVNIDSVAHIIVLYALVISLGLALGRLKLFGVSLGVTFVLFAVILVVHLDNVFGSTPCSVM